MTTDASTMSTAFHEAGHAVVLLSCGYGDQIRAVSLTPDHPVHAGLVSYAFEGVGDEFSGTPFPSDLNLAASFILTDFGGFAAEAAISGERAPAGWTSDMVKATTMIHYLATMDSRAALVTHTMFMHALRGRGDHIVDLVDLSDAVLENMLETVQHVFGRSLPEIIEDMIKEAMRRVSANRFAVMDIAWELIQEGQLDGPRVREIAEAATGWCSWGLISGSLPR